MDVHPGLRPERAVSMRGHGSDVEATESLPAGTSQKPQKGIGRQKALPLRVGVTGSLPSTVGKWFAPAELARDFPRQAEARASSEIIV
ncbi:hypothetical protein [Microvirga massiliensis]|uniref:hypothetical protein n=1 Tax=Microvirga massiliensis TaxID=1033741 RepID=UPI00062B3E81|nr:hypothetical protein [Microvirga massiliensis]